MVLRILLIIFLVEGYCTAQKDEQFQLAVSEQALKWFVQEDTIVNLPCGEISGLSFKIHRQNKTVFEKTIQYLAITKNEDQETLPILGENVVVDVFVAEDMSYILKTSGVSENIKKSIETLALHLLQYPDFVGKTVIHQNRITIPSYNKGETFVFILPQIQKINVSSQADFFEIHLITTLWNVSWHRQKNVMNVCEMADKELTIKFQFVDFSNMTITVEETDDEQTNAIFSKKITEDEIYTNEFLQEIQKYLSLPKLTPSFQDHYFLVHSGKQKEIQEFLEMPGQAKIFISDQLLSSSLQKLQTLHNLYGFSFIFQKIQAQDLKVLPESKQILLNLHEGQCQIPFSDPLDLQKLITFLPTVGLNISCLDNNQLSLQGEVLVLYRNRPFLKLTNINHVYGFEYMIESLLLRIFEKDKNIPQVKFYKNNNFPEDSRRVINAWLAMLDFIPWMLRKNFVELSETILQLRISVHGKKETKKVLPGIATWVRKTGNSGLLIYFDFE